MYGTKRVAGTWRRAAVLVLVGGLAYGASGLSSARAEDKLDEAVDATQKRNKDGKKSQARVDKLHDSEQSLLAEYRNALEQADALKIYNRQVKSLLGSQQKEIDSLNEQVGRATVFSRSLTPLIFKMIDALDQFVKLDVPFLPDERAERIKKLKQMVDRSDIADSEKYRQVLEAYRVEVDYGRNIEHYKGTLDAGGEQRTVDFLRIGRLALLYRTLDGQEVGAWNQAKRAWERLPERYRDAVRDGVRVARKEKSATNLLWVPVPPPQEGSK